jgi:alkylhydroperoxidase family enzyme
MTSEPHFGQLLRRLALNDVRTVDATLGGRAEGADSPLGPKSRALVQLAALIACEGSAASYQWAVAVALGAGASEDEIVDVLVSVAQTVGAARTASAASPLAAALGVDIDTFDA